MIKYWQIHHFHQQKQFLLNLLQLRFFVYQQYNMGRFLTEDDAPTKKQQRITEDEKRGKGN